MLVMNNEIHKILCNEAKGNYLSVVYKSITTLQFLSFILYLDNLLMND